MIYKAFLNRQEITGFPVKGKDITKIYGGDILLWEKSGIPSMKEICCARGTYYWTSDLSGSYETFNEIEFSVRNQTENGKTYLTQNTKVGYYLEYSHTSGQSFSCRAHVMYDGVVIPEKGSNYFLNVKKTYKKYDMSENLLEKTEEWQFSTLVDKNKPGIYQVGFGNGVSLGLNALPINGMVTGGVGFDSLEKLKEYMGVS